MRSPAVVVHRRLDSTQDELSRLAENDAPDGTAVVAAEQTAGRGRRGATWSSPPGGLWLSVLRRPAPPPSRASEPLVVSLSAGLAVADALERAGVGGIMIKWPNDLMLGDAKVGGILTEMRWHGDALQWAAIGVGINVENRPPPVLRRAATWLGHQWPALTPDRLVRPVVRALRELSLEATRLDPRSVDALARRDWLNGRSIHEPRPGVCRGIDPTGALLIAEPSGAIARVDAGRIVVADAPTGREPADGEPLTPRRGPS